jgi:hypothetical protein
MHRSFREITLCVLLAAVVETGAVAQVQIKLLDISGESSPIRVSGHIAFSDNPSKVTRYSYQVTASATNTANEDILLMVMHFEASAGDAPGLDDTYRHEYFFSNKALEPGVSESVHCSPLIVSAPFVNGKPVETDDPSTSEPRATAQVEFVQFRDGSTWGNPEAAKDDLKSRQATLQELELLERTYRESGESIFRDQLSRQVSLPCISSLKSSCKDNRDYSRCALDKIREMLVVARNHQKATRWE